jgi:hypothetical protein
MDDPAVLRERVNQLQQELDTYRAKARAFSARGWQPRGGRAMLDAPAAQGTAQALVRLCLAHVRRCM